MHRIIQADCISVLRRLKTKSVDLLLTDPPYGINIAGRVQLGKSRRQYKRSSWDKAPPAAEYFTEMLRVSKHQIIWGGNYFLDNLRPTRCMLVWYKKDGLPRNSFADCEIAWTSFDRTALVFNSRRCGFVRDSREPQYPHPTQKALDVMKWCVEEFSKKGDTILDPFLGTGTTGVAAKLLGRRFIGVERDRDYVAIARKRLATEGKK